MPRKTEVGRRRGDATPDRSMVDAFREISTQQRLRELDNLYGNNDELMAKKYAQAMNVKPESARQRVHAWRQGAAMRPAAYNALKRHAPRLPR